MNINEMTRKQFEELHKLEYFKTYDCDSIVLLPTRLRHNSGFNYYTVIVCNKWNAVGKMDMYDTAAIMMESRYNRIGIDCLRGSGLMRIFLPPNEYQANPVFHEIRKKNKE